MRTTKILIDGGPGTGKTTFIGSVSDIDPVTTEVPMTAGPDKTDRPDRGGRRGRPSDGDHAAPVGSGRSGANERRSAAGRPTTTAALDFGRLTIDGDHNLLLFGTPSSGHLPFLQDDLATGALGAVVLVDPRRPADSYPAMTAAKERGQPFVVAVNTHGRDRSQFDQALRMGPDVPVAICDAGDRAQAKAALLTLLQIIGEVGAGSGLGSARLRAGGAATVGGIHLLHPDRIV